MNATENTTTQPQLIAASRLEKSPLNARRTGAKTGLDELKASLLAHGLMQHLVVTDARDGPFRVIAGGADTPAAEFDAWLDAFASAEADDALDRQLFAIRESLADFRSL